MKEDVGEPLIRVRFVSKHFNNHCVLQNISLDIQPGEIYGIIGVSGSGKTTLLQLLVGFIKPSEGDVEFYQGPARGIHGTNPRNTQYSSISKFPDKIKKYVGFAAQRPSFYKELTVIENLAYFGALYNLPDSMLQQNIRTSLSLVGLQNESGAIAGELSGGMQKRLDIAISLVHNPKLLILDEPTADLDVFNRRLVWKLLKKINATGTTIIIASHFLEEIEHLCSRIAILHNQKIENQGSIDDLRHLLEGNQEVHLELRSRDYAKIRAALNKQKIPITNMTESDGIFIAHSPESEKVLHSLLHLVEQHKEEVVDVYLHRPTLNQIFESMIGRSN